MDILKLRRSFKCQCKYCGDIFFVFTKPISRINKLCPNCTSKQPGVNKKNGLDEVPITRSK